MSSSEYLDANVELADILEVDKPPAVELCENTVYKSKPVYDIIKRLFDVVLSSMALIILSPFLVIVMAIIYIDDHEGSPIFSQNRCGRNGKLFKIYKLRTMCCNAEKKA